MHPDATSDSAEVASVYRYNICNGLSNQLIHHSASIAKSAYHVLIPNHFIVDGTQTTDEPVLPLPGNSVSLDKVFDTEYLLTELQKLGIGASLYNASNTHVPCAGMEVMQQVSDPDRVLQIMRLFRPAPLIQAIVQNITQAIDKRGFSIDDGVCLHHRVGPDWRKHCQRWSSIDDATYRGNCLALRRPRFAKLLQNRGVTKEKWLYYCGDQEVPKHIRDLNGISHHDLADTNSVATVAAMGGVSQRDIWALIDFFVCNSLSHFIGNSVSTFSALQIALRSSNASFWYNSQSIPLANMWPVYPIPIVYTYTELSKMTGQYMLKASIMSVRQHMPHNPIHILYHGSEDFQFRNWLLDQNVQIHIHNPEWKDQIEKMRRNGDPAKSTLFLHAGSYFGTWQRIDIPLFVKHEYCLLLDADTVVVRPFTFADFGLDLTFGVAMSSEFTYDDSPLNAGVMLMNIPRLRQTYERFLQFILDHVPTARFDHPSPSDQGAYHDFYSNELSMLPNVFNFKPYWKLEYLQPRKRRNQGTRATQQPFIVHFHGAKPHDYLKSAMRRPCDYAIQFLCRSAAKMPFLCQATQYFAKSSNEADLTGYCRAIFHDQRDIMMCNEVFNLLANQPDGCKDFNRIVRQARKNLPAVDQQFNSPVVTDGIDNHFAGMQLLLQPLVIVGLVFVFASNRWYARLRARAKRRYNR